MNGVFLVDKPTDMTSFGVVARLRRLTNEKCGHSGTLDPLATGLLPIMVGKATKLCDFLTAGEKSYQGTLRFGVRTDTEDSTGTFLEQQPWSFGEREILAVLPRFTGQITQTPPAYSAIKVNGVPLYRRARAGQAVTAPERKVQIRGLRLLSFDQEKGEAVFEVDCSKGTYIRTLFSDLARALGTVGTMTALRRTCVGRFSVAEAVPLEELMAALERGTPTGGWRTLEEVLEALPCYRPTDFFGQLLQNGCAVSIIKLGGLPAGLCTVYHRQKLVGLGNTEEKDGETFFKVVTHL